MKPTHWKQATPQDQFVAILAALEGELSNFQDGITPRETFVARAADKIAQYRLLEPYLRGQPWDDCTKAGVP